jgi:hypothetical protein
MKNFKIVSIFIVLALVVAMLAACGSDPIKDDLKTYFNDQLPAIRAMSDNATNAYNAVEGDNYTDDVTVLAALNDSIVSDSSDALAAAQELAPATEEVAALNDQFVEVLTAYNTAYTMLQDALTNEDAAEVTEAATAFADAETMNTEFVTALNTLAEDHGLTVTTK